MGTASEGPAREVVVGLMSGTSADAIDVAICRCEGDRPTVRLLYHAERPLPTEIQERVRRADQLRVRDVAELAVRVGEAFADACLDVLAEAKIAPSEVSAIGSHGQTLYHHSGVPGAIRATLQVGDGDVIAERTGCRVVSDFRARDIAAGGEGAPLTPIADAVLFAEESQGPSRRRVVLNLGGIANLTVLGPGTDEVAGFDTGPANGPLDRLARIMSGGSLSFDRDGDIGRSGRVNSALLDWLLESDAFLARRPPKSTGFETYGDAFVEAAAARHGGLDADLMTTLTEFSALCVVRSIPMYLAANPPIGEVIAAGGGVKNSFLMSRIVTLLAPIPVRGSDELGVPSDAREAMAFALFAWRAVRGIPSDLSSITGAAGPRVLGKISHP